MKTTVRFVVAIFIALFALAFLAADVNAANSTSVDLNSVLVKSAVAQPCKGCKPEVSVSDLLGGKGYENSFAHRRAIAAVITPGIRYRGTSAQNNGMRIILSEHFASQTETPPPASATPAHAPAAAPTLAPQPPAAVKPASPIVVEKKVQPEAKVVAPVAPTTRVIIAPVAPATAAPAKPDVVKAPAPKAAAQPTTAIQTGPFNEIGVESLNHLPPPPVPVKPGVVIQAPVAKVHPFISSLFSQIGMYGKITIDNIKSVDWAKVMIAAQATIEAEAAKKAAIAKAQVTPLPKAEANEIITTNAADRLQSLVGSKPKSPEAKAAAKLHWLQSSWNAIKNFFSDYWLWMAYGVLTFFLIFIIIVLVNLDRTKKKDLPERKASIKRSYRGRREGTPTPKDTPSIEDQVCGYPSEPNSVPIKALPPLPKVDPSEVYRITKTIVEKLNTAFSMISGKSSDEGLVQALLTVGFLPGEHVHLLKIARYIGANIPRQGTGSPNYALEVRDGMDHLIIPYNLAVANCIRTVAAQILQQEKELEKQKEEVVDCSATLAMHDPVPAPA